MLSYKDIKFLQKNKKARDVQGLFVAEGGRLFTETPPGLIEQVLMTRKYAAEHPEVWEHILPGTPVDDGIDEARFFSLTDTKTPQGILAVVRKKSWSYAEVTQVACPLYVILENMQDPGNAGTVLRTGEAAGVTAVFLTEGSVDLYSPKTIRSTMGSVYRVPHFVVRDAPSLIADLAKKDVASYAAHLRGRGAYTAYDYRGGAAFVIGNEGNGLTDAAAESCTHLVRIPMMGRVESLNAAMAAGILMYEALRQRRQ
ncbi:MAG: RNA methyltransferase [Lachnospiraceae bacterium]|nr:RNA methyltransferase [Lachnospiraceae bacterium]